jgi:predicted PurR-regulated permease PerM
MLSSLGSGTINFFSSLISSFAQLILVITLAVFFSLEKNHVVEWTASLAGKRKQNIQVKMEKVTQKL